MSQRKMKIKGSEFACDGDGVSTPGLGNDGAILQSWGKRGRSLLVILGVPWLSCQASDDGQSGLKWLKYIEHPRSSKTEKAYDCFRHVGFGLFCYSTIHDTTKCGEPSGDFEFPSKCQISKLQPFSEPFPLLFIHRETSVGRTIGGFGESCGLRVRYPLSGDSVQWV